MATTTHPGLPVLAAPQPQEYSLESTSTSRRPSATESEHTLADSRDQRDLEKGGRKVEREGSGPSHEDEGETPEGPVGAGEKTSTPEDDPFLVTLKSHPDINPHTWSVWYRWFLTGLAGFLVLNATFASSAPSGLVPSIIEHYDVSQEVGILLISIFVAGYCIGPLLWGPLSERYGRRLVFLGVWGPYIGMQVGCALSPNIGSMIVFRFLGGCFAASPLTNSGGVIADLWDSDRRGDALAIFSLMPFAGPALAPVISGAMQVTGTNFRWIFWVLTAFAGLCGVGIVFLLPETYVPYLLHLEAKKLRKETGDQRWHAAMDKKQEAGVKALLHRTVAKPFIMIAQEPMLAVITLYMAFVYGIVYLLFEAIPIVFEGQHGLNALKSGLVFLALLSGGFAAVLLYIFYFNVQYTKKHNAIKPAMVPPEERLTPLLYFSPLFAAAFFWFVTGAYSDISIWSPIMAIFVLGACILFVFLAGFNYLIDTYLFNAASALAINTVARSTFGAGFPLFATQMYTKLGIVGATCLLGGLAVVFIPVPFLLKKYGKRIRGMSKNAIVLD